MSIKSVSTKDSSDSCSTKSDNDSEVDSSTTSDDESNFVLVEIPHTDTKTVCKLCFRTAQPPDSSLKLGPLYQYGYCAAHLYCLMFSAGLDQNGSDDEGINGFLVKDIVKEWRRGSQLRCTYCKERYATLGCVGKNCKKGYHLPCALENGGLQQFFGNFVSYCEAHKPVQLPYLDKKRKKEEYWKKRDECGCCTMELEDGELTDKDFLWTPCCNGWFHRSCVEKTAENAGAHFFKCPLCNNKDDFTEEMQQFGVYVPDRDANWETGGEFDDQLQRHDTCDADTCLCPSGRKFDEEDTPWEIMLCVCCGAQGIHVQCGNLDVSRPRWKCPMCKPVIASLDNKPISVFTRVKRNKEPPNQKFTRNVLENLTFRFSDNYDIDVEMHKNRRDPKDPVVVGFKVKGVPAFDIPMPVKLKKNELDNETDKVKNIPCPFNDCEELLSRLEFKEHCKQHREKQPEEDNSDPPTAKDDDKSNALSNEGSTDSNERSIDDQGDEEVPVSVAEPKDTISNTTDESKCDDQEVPVSVKEPKDSFNNVTSESETVESQNDQSIEIVEEVVNSSPVNNKQSAKQATILSFFKRFSPKIDAETPPTKKKKKEGSKNSPVLKTPEKKEEEKATVISSPVGYFKVDEDISIKSPLKRKRSEDDDSLEDEARAPQRPKVADRSKFICQFCKMSFTNLLSWKSHENTHKGLQLQCTVCKEEFKNKKALDKHENEKHKKNVLKETKNKTQRSNAVQYCDSCDYYTTNKANLKKHVERKHSKVGNTGDKDKSGVYIETADKDKENNENNTERCLDSTEVHALSTADSVMSGKENKKWMEIAEDWN